ncbi:MAG: hypothetical protein GX676_01115 [Bacilli bacterium]|nr:hypothetical protein [Bacilli bacterium]
MEETPLNYLLNIIKMPFIFIIYLLYMLLTLIIPSKYIGRIFKIEVIEEHLNLYFTNHIFLKIIALIITVIIFICFGGGK